MFINLKIKHEKMLSPLHQHSVKFEYV